MTNARNGATPPANSSIRNDLLSVQYEVIISVCMFLPCKGVGVMVGSHITVYGGIVADVTYCLSSKSVLDIKCIF